MIKFKPKNFTIPEGHYSGTKDIEEIPSAAGTILKGAGLGAGVGALAGGVSEYRENKDISLGSILGGAKSGAELGTLSGIAYKLLLNYYHKPMTRIKYQEVDKNIRRQFGMFQVSGMVIGDSVGKRAKLDERFSFGDRDVAKYKLNFATHNDIITMYTFGLSDEELKKVDKVLDYYCHKYFAMEYTSKIINQKVNSYSVDITFTNYQAITSFIIELGETLGTKINLLDNNSIVAPRLSEASEKTFSLINKYDASSLIKTAIGRLILTRNKRDAIEAVMETAGDAIMKLGNNQAQSFGNVSGMKKGDLNNNFLISTLKKLHYVDGFHYTVGEEGNEVQLSLTDGILILAVTKDNEKKVDNQIYNHLKAKMNKIVKGDVIIYTYSVNKINEFEMVVNKIMKLLKPNIYEKELIHD